MDELDIANRHRGPPYHSTPSKPSVSRIYGEFLIEEQTESEAQDETGSGPNGRRKFPSLESLRKFNLETGKLGERERERGGTEIATTWCCKINQDRLKQANK